MSDWQAWAALAVFAAVYVLAGAVLLYLALLGLPLLPIA